MGKMGSFRGKFGVFISLRLIGKYQIPLINTKSGGQNLVVADKSKIG